MSTAKILLKRYTAALQTFNATLQNKLYQVAIEAIRDTWNWVSVLKNLFVNFNGENEICDRSDPSKVLPCSQFDKFDYVFTTGSARKASTDQEIKLVFLLINIEHKIRENNEPSLFQTLDVLVKNSDNYLRSSFKNYLSVLTTLYLNQSTRNYEPLNIPKHKASICLDG